ncbi:hypothetical protein ACVBEQ_14510 [Nakamurella sp. GG22]
MGAPVSTVVDASVVDTAGIDTAGIDTAGIDMTGVDASGIETALFDAVQAVAMSRRAITEAADRREAAVTSARYVMEAAEVAERAEQAAATAAAEAALRRLAAQGLTPAMIGRLCSIPAGEVRCRLGGGTQPARGTVHRAPPKTTRRG